MSNYETFRDGAQSQGERRKLASEFLTQIMITNPIHYYLVFSLLIGYFSCTAFLELGFKAFIVLVFAGLMLWSIAEYFIHRYVFHFKTSRLFLKSIVFLLHGIHHGSPRDVSKSITPLIISLPLAVIFYYIFTGLFSEYGQAIFTGFMLGYVVYSIIHDSTHHMAMNFPGLRQLKKHHMYHHYFDNNKNFGVTSPVWDYLFNTRNNKG